jgi:hypothetical protein
MKAPKWIYTLVYIMVRFKYKNSKPHMSQGQRDIFFCLFCVICVVASGGKKFYDTGIIKIICHNF